MGNAETKALAEPGSTAFDDMDSCERGGGGGGGGGGNPDLDSLETPEAASVLALLGFLVLILGLHQCFHTSPWTGAAAIVAVIMLVLAAVRTCATSAFTGLLCLLCSGKDLIAIGVLLLVASALWELRLCCMKKTTKKD